MFRQKLYRIFIWAFCGLPIAVHGGTKLLPVLNQPIADRTIPPGAVLEVDLAAAFAMEPIDDQVVRFTSTITSNGVPMVLDIAMFSNRTPVTRTNFLKYVADGDYENTVIHRSVPGFVIQGGGFVWNNNVLSPIATDPPIVNEFGISNTLGTVSMAKQAGNPNSATSQWFVSIGANSDILDPQNGGFTVFGRMTRSTIGNAQTFGNPAVFPVSDLGGELNSLPMLASNGALIRFASVELVPIPAGEAGESPGMNLSVLTSNPGLMGLSFSSPGVLRFVPQSGQDGVATITVRASDSVGNVVEDRFLVAVRSSYDSWASQVTFPDGRSGSADNPDGDLLTNLQEYAFLGESIGSGDGGTPASGVTGEDPGQKFMTLTFPIRRYATGLSYVVEASNTMTGSWSEVWKSGDGYSHPQVVSAVGQSDRVLVTIKDTVAVGGQQQRFLRTKVVRE